MSWKERRGMGELLAFQHTGLPFEMPFVRIQRRRFRTREQILRRSLAYLTIPA